MSSSRQFHVFRDGNNFSSDQLALISAQVDKRSRVLDAAMGNLQKAMECIERKPAFEAGQPEKPAPAKQIVKKPAVLPAQPSNQEVLKGKVSYKVKGPDGKPMNIAEIKSRINSIYDGEQGIIKQ